ncbi:VOC family protein [Streptomyces sp. NPDC013178]|uniref:VOC family protein n=1 Tax=unclassified Streptomyces TaxID=2593676 RepID=UPI0033F13A73
MTTGLQTIIYPVKDIDRAKALFSALLGVEPYADEPYYVGFKAAGQDVGLDPNGHAKGMTGPVPYWHVDDIRARLAALLEAGAEVLQDVQDVGGGRLIAYVKDADGNLVGLLQNPAAS